MSVDIIYEIQALKIKTAQTSVDDFNNEPRYIVSWLIGCNNVTVKVNGHDRCVREWSVLSSGTESEIMRDCCAMSPGFVGGNFHMPYGKWLAPQTFLNKVDRAIQTCKTNELNHAKATVRVSSIAVLLVPVDDPHRNEWNTKVLDKLLSEREHKRVTRSKFMVTNSGWENVKADYWEFEFIANDLKDLNIYFDHRYLALFSQEPHLTSYRPIGLDCGFKVTGPGTV